MSLPVKNRAASSSDDSSIDSFSSDISIYIPMPDGVKIAVDIWLPKAAKVGDEVPVMVEFTRYWRVVEGNAPRDRILYFPKLGFAHAVVDCRGSGASFGVREAEQSVAEVKDFAQVINWLAEQPWSNGAVISIGSSYSGNTAEFAMIDAPAALKASIPRFSDFDFYTTLLFPGGLFNRCFSKPWGDGVCAMDRNTIGDDIHPQWEGYHHQSVKPVGDDVDRVLLKQAVADHQKNVPFLEYIRSKIYRDDFSCAIELSQSGERWVTPHLVQDNPRLRQVPSYHWASFTDAGTAAGAIARFMGTGAPMKVVIGYWSHGGMLDTNPYKTMGGEASPSFEAQFTHLAKYLAGLKCPESDVANRLRERALYYYTAGEEVWKKTDLWPPRGVEMQRWYLSNKASLTLVKPQNRSGKDQYRVDFEVGTGAYTRWDQMVPEVHYGNRAEADKRLLTYTSKPLEHAIEITGHPLICLQMSSTRTDGAVFAYLESVAPDGTVTMLTEGELRLIHRKVSSEKSPYPVFGPFHTFEKKDALPMPVGEPVEISFDCLPLSIRVEKDYALRVAIAGHDKDCFERLPPEGEQTFDIFRTIDAASYIELPIRAVDNTLPNDEIVDPFY